MISPAIEGKPVTAKFITTELRTHLRLRAQGSVILPNVYVGTSPWESDMICVRKTLFWVEYEIKTSVADYRNDFAKRRNRWDDNSLRKHEAYQGDGPIEIRSNYGDRKSRFTPKPKQFYFVVPKGLLGNEDVPTHCGVMEFEENDRSGLYFKVTRRAPNLKSPTKLDIDAVFNLAMKASYRMGRTVDAFDPDRFGNHEIHEGHENQAGSSFA